MKKLILMAMAISLVACSSKNNLSGGKVSMEKDGVTISAEFQTKDVEAVPAEEEVNN